MQVVEYLYIQIDRRHVNLSFQYSAWKLQCLSVSVCVGLSVYLTVCRPTSSTVCRRSVSLNDSVFVSPAPSQWFPNTEVALPRMRISIVWPLTHARNSCARAFRSVPWIASIPGRQFNWNRGYSMNGLNFRPRQPRPSFCRSQVQRWWW